MRKPVGHIRRHGTGYQVIVPAGVDPITKRYRYQYEQTDTLPEAEAARDRTLADLAAGREPRTKATFGELVDRMLEVADLEPRHDRQVVPADRRGRGSRDDRARAAAL